MRLIILIFLIISLGYLNAQEKKTAALAPLASMGNLDEIQKRVIFNTLQESLSKYYILSSQKMYEKAEEEAFQQMDANECTEDQCIAIIQELLQVEYFFMFEILQSDDFQQLKITRVDLDGNRDVRTSTCVSCEISQTNSKVDQLVLSVFEQYNAINEKVVATNDQTTAYEVGASAYWEMIKDSKDKLKYQDFIKKFPTSSLRIVAQTKIDEINRKEKEYFDEQQRIADEKARKDKIITDRKKRIKIALEAYWENKKCEKFSIDDNFYTAEIFLISRPYGINTSNGKIIKRVEEADRLFNSGDIQPSNANGTQTKYFRIFMSSISYYASLAYSTSFTSNTECYQSRNNINIAKKYIEFNYNNIIEDLAKGKGGNLEALYTIFGCPSHEYSNLNLSMIEWYNGLYNQSMYLNSKVNRIISKVDHTINKDPWLKGSCNSFSPVNIIALN